MNTAILLIGIFIGDTYSVTQVEYSTMSRCAMAQADIVKVLEKRFKGPPWEPLVVCTLK